MDMKNTANNEKSNLNEAVSKITEIAIVSPRRLKRFLRRWEKNEDEIEDIIGASLLNAIRSLHSYTGESSMETWFFGVCKNTARQHVATKIQMARHFINIDDSEDAETKMPDLHAMSTEDEAIKNEQLKDMLYKLKNLPDDQLQVFQEIYIDGNSYEQVAQQLKIPLGTLKSRVNRMRTNLINRVLN